MRDKKERLLGILKRVRIKIAREFIREMRK